MATPIRVASTQQLQTYGIAIGVEGVSMAVYEYGISYLKKRKFMAGVVKTLKNWTDAVLALVISVVSYALLANTLPEYGVRAVRVLGSWGIKEAILVGFKYRPSVAITSKTTIEAFNLDAGKNVELWIDGSKVDTTAKTDDKGYVKIELSKELSAEVHKVLVHTGFKSTYTEQYIE
jgi:hypothetical protein